MKPYDRALGCLQAMMVADAMSYPSMMRGRYMTLPWIDRIMHKVEAHGIAYRNTKPVIPFVWHKGEVLRPTPTYVSEYALFTATMLNDLKGEISLERISAYWQQHIVAEEAHIRSGVSERSAIINFKKGYQPPITGSDHPHTYDDGFVSRAIPIALYAYESSERMREILQMDGSVTHADEGIYAGAAMAHTIAAGMQGATVEEMVEAGMRELPADSWVGMSCRKAVDLVSGCEHAFDVIPALDMEVTSRIYNYGNIAAETLAVAYGLFLASQGNLRTAVPLALALPRLADSVPAFVGAMCGVRGGIKSIPPSYEDFVHSPQGVCIPHMKEIDLKQITRALMDCEVSAND